MRGLFGLKKKSEDQKQSVSMDHEKPASGDAKYIVLYDRKACIGAGVCAAVDGKHWEMATDGKARLKNSAKKSDDPPLFEREITEAEFEELSRAADGCPPRAISIIKKDTGEKIV